MWGFLLQYLDELAQECGISITNALEIPWFYTEPSIYSISQDLCTQFMLWCVGFCCGSVPVGFTHILQGYFTRTGAIAPVPVK